jgi:hypothetical protein
MLLKKHIRECCCRTATWRCSATTTGRGKEASSMLRRRVGMTTHVPLMLQINSPCVTLQHILKFIHNLEGTNEPLSQGYGSA